MARSKPRIFLIEEALRVLEHCEWNLESYQCEIFLKDYGLQPHHVLQDLAEDYCKRYEEKAKKRSEDILSKDNIEAAY